MTRHKSTVTVASDREAIAERRAAVTSTGLIEVGYPPLAATVHDARFGTDRYVPAPDGLSIAGTPFAFGRQTAAWIADLIEEHAAVLAVVTPYLVKAAVEGGQTLDQIADLLSGIGSEVLLDTSALPGRVDPRPAPELPSGPLPGAASAYLRGSVRGVDRTQVHRLEDVIATVGRDACSLTFNLPATLAIQRHGRSADRITTTTHRPERPVRVWLIDALRSFEPALLLVENDAGSRAGLTLSDWCSVAKGHNVAVGLLPGRDDTRTTPQTIEREAQ